MVVIKVGESYNINFQFKNNSQDTIAQNVVATVNLPVELTLNSITSTQGAAGPGTNEYTLGSALPNEDYNFIVNVTVVNESDNLPVTLIVTTSNPESNTTNNILTKNLVSELEGILCSGLAGCAADNLGNHTATLPLNMASNYINGEYIPVYASKALALVGLGLGRKFRWTFDNLDGVPSPDNSNIGYTG